MTPLEFAAYNLLLRVPPPDPEWAVEAAKWLASYNRQLDHEEEWYE